MLDPKKFVAANPLGHQSGAARIRVHAQASVEPGKNNIKLFERSRIRHADTATCVDSPSSIMF